MVVAFGFKPGVVFAFNKMIRFCECFPVFQTIQSQPHNRQAEEAVLGSVLINPESYYDVAQILEADYFYIIRNRWIVALFLSQRAQQNVLDQVEPFGGDIEVDQKAAQQVYRLYRLFLVSV